MTLNFNQVTENSGMFTIKSEFCNKPQTSDQFDEKTLSYEMTNSLPNFYQPKVNMYTISCITIMEPCV